MNTEKQLQNYTKKLAAAHGILFYKLVCVGRRGFPDVLLAYSGQLIFIELKTARGTGRLHPLQEMTINELKKQGAHVYVADSKETINAIIAGLIKA
jgi:hypothetical protein